MTATSGPWLRISLLFFLEETDKTKVITRQQALSLEAKGGSEAAKLREGIGREYLFGQTLAHLLGYLGEADPQELLDRSIPLLGKDYQLGDRVGRTGLEEKFDLILRGKNGQEIFEVDHLGQEVRSLGRLDPVRGSDLTLSIDAQISKKALENLEGKPGAVIVSRPNGQLISLVSSPSFDPNLLSSGINIGGIEAILTDSSRPLFNRAISAAYPPGSVFKIITASAGLEEEKITPQTIIEDTGVVTIKTQYGTYKYHNWYFTQYGGVEGEVNLTKALTRSVDTYFYRVGEKLGANLLADWAKRFGLGALTQIDLPAESAGLVPSPQWKEKELGEKWFLGNTFHFAIGQADLLTTPLQINLMMAAIANGGKLCRPTIVTKGEHLNLSEKPECVDLGLNLETIKAIKKGLTGACSEGGTAYPLFDFDPGVACKTGTAQYANPNDKTHAWLTAFAPIENPQIVVTVLLEGGGEGSHDAAPIAKKVFESWFGI